MATVRDSARFVSWYKKRYGINLARRHSIFLEEVGYFKPSGLDAMFEISYTIFKVSKESIESKSRDPEAMDMKRIISTLLRNKISRGQIAKIMGGLDQSSINHHWNSYENLYKSDSEFKRKADIFIEHFNQI